MLEHFDGMSDGIVWPEAFSRRTPLFANRDRRGWIESIRQLTRSDVDREVSTVTWHPQRKPLTDSAICRICFRSCRGLPALTDSATDGKTAEPSDYGQAASDIARQSGLRLSHADPNADRTRRKRVTEVPA